MIEKKWIITLIFLSCLVSEIGQASTVSYKYDSLNRLVEVLYENTVTIQYAYDAAGNRLSQKVIQLTPVLSVSPSSRTFNKESGTTSFSVTNAGSGTLAWTATVTSGGTWLSIQSGASGTNSGTITCAFTANTGTTSRTGTIRVTATGAAGSPKDIIVTQGIYTSPIVSGNVKTTSGKALSGVTITFSNGGGTVVTDSNGYYSKALILYSWSGTATPSKAGYTFSPVSRTYTNVLTSQSGQNYSAVTSASQFLGVWSDGVWSWNKATKQWIKMANTANALMIASGKVDTDTTEDLIGVWSSGLYYRKSTTGQWVKLSTSLPSWITAGDMNNDGRDDVIGSWKGDGVYYWNPVNGKWVKVTTSARQLATGNVHGDGRDDLVGVWDSGLWVLYSATNQWQKIDGTIPIWITTGDLSGSGRSDIVGSYGSGTWVRYSKTGAWLKITTPAEQVAAGDLDGDGRDDLIGVWSNGLWALYSSTNKWELITASKPRWIITGKMAEALQAAFAEESELESPDETGFIDLSHEGPG